MKSTFKSNLFLLLSWCLLVLHSMNFVVWTYELYKLDADTTTSTNTEKLGLLHIWDEAMHVTSDGSESGEESEQSIKKFTESISDFIISHSHKIETTCEFMSIGYDAHLPLFLPNPCIELHLCPPELV